MNHSGDANKMVGEDHIPDATKMVSDTPRTNGCLTAILDTYGYVHQGNCPQRWVNHSRELERELNAASKERDDALMMLGMYRMKSEEQNQRIKRLEEDSDRLHWLLKRGLAWRGCYNGHWLEGEWLYSSQYAIETIDKAKEDKP